MLRTQIKHNNLNFDLSFITKLKLPLNFGTSQSSLCSRNSLQHKNEYLRYNIFTFRTHIVKKVLLVCVCVSEFHNLQSVLPFVLSFDEYVMEHGLYRFS